MDTIAQTIKTLASDMRVQIIELDKLIDPNKSFPPLPDESAIENKGDILALEKIIDNSDPCSSSTYKFTVDSL